MRPVFLFLPIIPEKGNLLKGRTFRSLSPAEGIIYESDK